MKPLMILPALALLMGGAFSASAKKVDFKTSLATAKKQAAIEGKPYFIDFVASWCMPCRWMDETTFADPRVSDYISRNYIAVKIDIDDFDGFALKQQYNIKLLPTLLFFDSQGRQLGRYEESLPPSKMLKILNQFNRSENRIQTMPSQPQASVPQIPQRVVDDIKPESGTSGLPLSNQQSTGISRPALPQARKPRPMEQKPNIQSITTRPPAARPNHPPARQTNTISPPVVSGEGLFRFSAERIPSSGFSVQIGAFGEYGNVLREVAKLEQQYDKSVLVHIANHGGKTIYKVMLGAFPTKGEAINYQQFLKRKQVTGIIKDLSTML